MICGPRVFGGRNLLQDEGDHLKIGEYWVQMFYEQIHPNQDTCMLSPSSCLLFATHLIVLLHLKNPFAF